MAHKEQREFCLKVKEKYPNYFKNKKVLDIGSLDINGSVRDLFDNCVYIGLDVGEGKNVDVVGSGHLYDAPNNYFDTIISCEAFEHDMFYEKTVMNIIRMLKPGGLFLFTCASTGRPEHGTRRTSPFDAPLLIQVSEEWSDYYKNLTESDIRKIINFNNAFPDGEFQYRFENGIPFDLYFYGIKGGGKYLIDSIVPEFPKERFDGHIFVIDCWPDNESKENDLISQIKRLKIYNVPILITSHYPLKPEIQKMVDYYIFDKNNPILRHTEFNKYDVNSGRWSIMGETRIDNRYVFHHDYAIWEAMRNAFNFCKYLGKNIIHFMEYDNIPDAIQYRQAFMEKIIYHDAVIYEYYKGSTIDTHLGSYCSTYIFSIKTEIAIKVIDQIKNKEEFFSNKPNGWQLEIIFLEQLRKVTNDIYITDYIDNDKQLNTQAVWNRDGMHRNGPYFQVYLAVDVNDNLYVHMISGFHEKPADCDYLIEVNYRDYKKFHHLGKGTMSIHNIGEYKKGYTVKIYYEGIEVFKEFLGDHINEFRKLNKITNKEIKKIKMDHIPKQVNINFVDGPFLEILEDTKKTYNIQFINSKNNTIEYQLNMENNNWARCTKKYCVDWIIKVNGIDNDYYNEYIFNPEGKKVLISFESKSLGDTLAWIPYVEKFQQERKCKIVCSTFYNNLFKEQYSNIEFIEPGTITHGLYALFRIGIFIDNKKWDNTKHFINPKKEPLMKVASDILGLDYVELKPRLPILSVDKKKMISIGVHGTAQCKYWNNPTGWKDVINYLKERNYEIRLLSAEGYEYMGNNFYIDGLTFSPTPKIEDALKVIQESELFIGISSGLSWLAWASGTETILISGFTNRDSEPLNNIRRIINEDVCHGCWNKYAFDRGDWNWCPVHKNTERQFECTKSITSEQVINEIKLVLKE